MGEKFRPVSLPLPLSPICTHRVISEQCQPKKTIEQMLSDQLEIIKSGHFNKNDPLLKIKIKEKT